MESSLQTASTVLHDGKRIIVSIDPYYSAKYRDSAGKWIRKSTGTSDRESALRIAKQWEAEAKLRETGVIDERVEEMNRKGKRRITEVVNAYMDSLATKNRTAKYRNHVQNCINEFIESGGWKLVCNIEAQSVYKRAAELMKGGMASRTVNARLTAIRGFSRWLVPEHWHCDPLAGVKKPSPDADRRLYRRMLLPSEWPHLRSAAENAGIVAGVSGEDRVTLYMLAIQTGLRVNEIAGLTCPRVILSVDAPHVLCKAAGTKNRKPAKQYIDQELADRLQRLRSRKRKAASVFEFEDQHTLADVLRLDMAAARDRWISSAATTIESRKRREDDFLSAVNAESESLDFHSLRHTCGAWLILAGENIKVVQVVMRHATISLLLTDTPI